MVLRKLFRISGLLRAAVISGVIFYTVYLVFVRRNFFFETQKTELIFRDIKRSEEQKTGNEDEHLRNEKETVVNGEQHAGNDKENLRKNEIWSSLKFVGSSFLIPDDETLRKLTEAEQLTMYWKYINTVQVLCKNQTRVGKLADGGKEVCTDDIYKPQKPCIVYSFGSNYQFDFDVPMHNFYGCDVFTYDPRYGYVT